MNTAGVSRQFAMYPASIAMHPAIHKYDDETFDDMSEESEKKKNLSTLSLRNRSLWPVPSQGIVGQAKKKANEYPSEGEQIDQG